MALVLLTRGPVVLGLQSGVKLVRREADKRVILIRLALLQHSYVLLRQLLVTLTYQLFAQVHHLPDTKQLMDTLQALLHQLLAQVHHPPKARHLRNTKLPSLLLAPAEYKSLTRLPKGKDEVSTCYTWKRNI